MSFDFRTIRQPSGDPLLKYLAAMQRAMSKALTEGLVDQLDDSEDIFSAGIDTESGVKVQTGLNHNHKFTFNKTYYPPNDDEWMTCWLRGLSMGELRDFSEKNNTGLIYRGEPIIVNGSPFDPQIYDGSIGVKSIALRFNRPTSSAVNTEVIRIPDNDNMDIDSMPVGFSVFMRFRVFSIAQQNGYSRTLVEKIDDSAPFNGYMIQIRDSGRLLFIVNKFISPNQHNIEKMTAPGTIASDGTIYDCWFTYQVGNPPTLHIYVNGVDMTLSDYTDTVNWQTDRSDNSTWLMHRGKGTPGGYVYGDLFDFKFYDQKVVTSNGGIGNSVLFDGINDLIDCGNHADLWSQSLTKFSFSLWIYPTVLSSGFDRNVVDHGIGSAKGFGCDIDNPTDAIRFRIWNAAGSANNATSSALVANQWNHITCVYDNSLSSANGKIYVNAVLGSTTFNLTEAINLSDILELASASNDFQGYIRDFRWWTIKALTPTEITNVMNDAATAPTPNYWQKLDLDYDSPTDFISGTKTATLTNGASWSTSDIGNHFVNKYSISSIPIGQLMFANHWATVTELLQTCSFVTGDFTSDFDLCAGGGASFGTTSWTSSSFTI